MFVYLSPLSGELMQLRHPMLGCMVTPQNDRGVPAGMTWAADNGCFSQGERFNLDAFLGWLERSTKDRSDCLFATAPDVVGNAEATLRRSAPVLPLIRDLGYRAGYVAQDGFDAAGIDWDAFDALFIGGTTAWKRSERGGYAAIAEGRRRGKHVHVGRVNGGPFLRNVAMAGADSADGTGIPRNIRQNWPRMRRALNGLVDQPVMELWP